MASPILAGITVLDMTTALAGPFCSMLLGDIGADVIKVEMPGAGDGVRKWGPPFMDGSGATYVGFNRNKRSVTIDLHTPEGVEQFRQIAAKVDVVLENFRPGTMEKFGVAYNVLKQANPDLIYCSISGYGQTGPLAHRPAMDLMIQAIGGMMSLTGEPAGRPVKAAAPIADLMGGFSAAFSILASLYDRGKTKDGRALDISMLDTMIMVLGQSVTAYSMSGEAPQRLGNAHALMAPYQAFQTATRDLVISLATEKRWRQFCSIEEFSVLLGNAGYEDQAGRNKHRDALCAEINAIFMTRPAAYWMERLMKLGLPAAPVNDLPELMAEPHLEHRKSLLDVEYPEGSGNWVKVPGPPWRDVSVDTHRSPPTVGQHTAEVFEEFGVKTTQAADPA